MYVNVNGAPSFKNPVFSRASVNAGTTYTGSIADEVSDPNPADTLSFSKLSGPAWLVVSPQGALSGTPSIADAGTNIFFVGVKDSGELSATASLSINVNGPPAFAANPFTVPAITAGQLYSESITNQATDPNPGALLTFSKVSGPAWLHVTSDGLLLGTPTAADVGTNSFSVSVTDTEGLASNATMNLAVMPELSAPSLRISLSNNLLSLTWTGGNPPFQVQTSTNLAAGNWQNLGQPTTNRTLVVTPDSGYAGYRVQNSSP
jgi:hypothetical protein